MKHPSRKIMLRAIELARQGAKLGEHAVASIIVKGDDIIAEAYATVNGDHDPTCHAEINAIKLASKRLKSKRLEDCYIYSTYEPCSMCATAAIWGRMKGIIYGASRLDETQKNPWRVKLSAKNVIDKGDPKLELIVNFMRKECAQLLDL